MSKVLVIDDEKSISLAIQLIFSKRGIECDISNNLVDGMFKACHYPYDAVILDNMFPEIISGSDVETLMRDINIHTIMFTASEDKDLKTIKSKIIKKHKGGMTELVKEVENMCGKAKSTDSDADKWCAMLTKATA